MFDKYFLCSPRKGVTFTLHTSIEDINMRVLYESDFNKVKLQFCKEHGYWLQQKKGPCDNEYIQLT